MEDNDLVYLRGAGGRKNHPGSGNSPRQGLPGKGHQPYFYLMNVYLLEQMQINHFDFYRLDPHDIYDLVWRITWSGSA